MKLYPQMSFRSTIGATLLLSITLAQPMFGAPLRPTIQQQSLTAEETAAVLDAIEATAPIDPADAPTVGIFYSAKHANEEYPPMPSSMGMPVWSLGDGAFLINDLDSDSALSPTSSAMSMDIPEFPPDDGTGDTNGVVPMGLTGYAAPTNGLVLFPPVWQQDGTVSLSLFTDESNSVYDIFYCPDLTTQNWRWLTRGQPGQTNWQFSGLSPDLGFFIVGTMSSTNGSAFTDAYFRLVNHGGTSGSGIPDDWALANGLNPFDPNVGTDDPDGDGVDNYHEYLAGTNPHDTMIVAWGLNNFSQCDVPTGLHSPVALAGGFDFSLALLQDGTLASWGGDTFGQTMFPTGYSNWIGIAAGPYAGSALLGNSPKAWGSWYFAGMRPSMAHTNSLPNLSAIACGADHCLGLRLDGTVFTWGFTNEIYNTAPALSGVVAIAAGWNHNVALLNNGSVVAWGMNYGSFGWNLTNVPNSALSGVVAIAAGANHTLALKSDGTVVAWGAGNSTNGHYWADKGQSIVPQGLTGVAAISAGGYHSMAICSNGTVVTWGDLPPPSPAFGTLVGIGSGVTHGLAIRAGTNVNGEFRLPPIVDRNPKNTSALPGDTISFSAHGYGLADVYYQWQYEGVNIPGATSNTLKVANVGAGNVGNYRAIIYNGAGSVITAPATFGMIAPPQISSTTPIAPCRVVVTNWLQLSVTVTQAVEAPLTYQWFHDGILITNEIMSGASLNIFFQSVTNWQSNPINGDYYVIVANAAGSDTSAVWSVQVPAPAGATVCWGQNLVGETETPFDLTNAIAIAGGLYYSVAAKEDGTVEQWGSPSGPIPSVSNVVSLSTGYQTLGVQEDGTVINLGINPYLPPNLGKAKAVACGWDHSVVLLTNGTLMAWTDGRVPSSFNLAQIPASATNVTAISAHAWHTLALRGDGTVVTFGYNEYGVLDVPADLTNVVAVAAGSGFSLVLKKDGTLRAWGCNDSGQCNVAGISNVMAIAAGESHAVALLNNGTVIAWGDNTFGQTDVPLGLTQVKSIAAGDDTTLAIQFSPTVMYPVDVSKDLLLIYNSASTNSSNVCSYYLQHRPMVANANVLPIYWPATYVDPGVPWDGIQPADFTNNFLPQIQAWLNANPTKHPQYWVLFMEVPSLITTYGCGDGDPARTPSSVSCALCSLSSGIKPFINHINLTNAADCIGYIKKLEYFGTNYSPGKLIISASAGGYANTNYYFDDSRGTNYGSPKPDLGYSGATAVLAVNPKASVIYSNAFNDTVVAGHITNGTDVAGFFSWGSNGYGCYAYNNNYALNGTLVFTGHSGWYPIETVESFNGAFNWSDQGNASKWFSPNAFGGTNYSNTPVGAVSNKAEPYLSGINNSGIYFGLWATGKNFAICAWNSRANLGGGVMAPLLQVIGDPFTTR